VDSIVVSRFRRSRHLRFRARQATGRNVVACFYKCRKISNAPSTRSMTPNLESGGSHAPRADRQDQG
jgi:hypothetical protein